MLFHDGRHEARGNEVTQYRGLSVGDCAGQVQAVGRRVDIRERSEHLTWLVPGSGDLAHEGHAHPMDEVDPCGLGCEPWPQPLRLVWQVVAEKEVLPKRLLSGAQVRLEHLRQRMVGPFSDEPDGVEVDGGIRPILARGAGVGEAAQ